VQNLHKKETEVMPDIYAVTVSILLRWIPHETRISGHFAVN